MARCSLSDNYQSKTPSLPIICAVSTQSFRTKTLHRHFPKFGRDLLPWIRCLRTHIYFCFCCWPQNMTAHKFSTEGVPYVKPLLLFLLYIVYFTYLVYFTCLACFYLLGILHLFGTRELLAWCTLSAWCTFSCLVPSACLVYYTRLMVHRQPKLNIREMLNHKDLYGNTTGLSLRSTYSVSTCILCHLPALQADSKRFRRVSIFWVSTSLLCRRCKV